MLKRFEYVPSMRDIRSQRAVKLKLDYLVKIEKQRQEKIKEEKARKDKVHQKERIRELRKQQRREVSFTIIYFIWLDNMSLVGGTLNPIYKISFQNIKTKIMMWFHECTVYSIFKQIVYHLVIFNHRCAVLFSPRCLAGRTFGLVRGGRENIVWAVSLKL